MSKMLLLVMILCCSTALATPPPNTLSKNVGQRTSGNMSTRTRYFDSSGNSLGYKRTYDYGPNSTYRSYYFNKGGKLIGQELGKNPK